MAKPSVARAFIDQFFKLGFDGFETYNGNNLGLNTPTLRKEMARSTYLVMEKLGLVEGFNTSGTPFPDVPSTDPYFPYIQTLKNLNIVQGYEDGTFRPNENVLRGEMSKFLILGLELDQSITGSNTCSDIFDNTFVVYIRTLLNTVYEIKTDCASRPFACDEIKYYVLSGNSDGRFYPNNPVSHGEITKFFINGYKAKLRQNKLKDPKALKPIPAKTTVISNSSIQIDIDRTMIGFEKDVYCSASPYRLIGIIDSSSTSFIHSGLLSNKEYHYKVLEHGVPFVDSTHTDAVLAKIPAITIHSKPVGASWSNISTWVEGKLPNDTDIVEINGTIYVGGNISVRGLYISKNSTLKSASTTYSLSVNGDIYNEGIIQNVSLHSYGNIINTGNSILVSTHLYGKKEKTIIGTLQGTVYISDSLRLSRSLHCGGSVYLQNNYVTFSSPDDTLKVDGSLSDAGGTNGYVSVGRLISSNLKTRKLLFEASLNTHLVSNSSIEGDVFVAQGATITPETSQDKTLSITGSLENKGIINASQSSYFLFIKSYGDIINTGNFQAQINLIGKNPRKILGDIQGQILALDSIRLTNSLHCRNKFYLNNQYITFINPNDTLKISQLEETNGTQIGGTNGYISVGNLMSTQVKTRKLIFEADTAIHLFSSPKVYGDVLIEKGAIVKGSPGKKFTITGSIENKGEIGSTSSSPWQMYVYKNIINNGTWNGVTTSISWYAQNVTRYELLFSQDLQNWDPSIFIGNASLVDGNYDITSKITDGNFYYFKVRSAPSGATSGAWSEIRTINGNHICPPLNIELGENKRICLGNGVQLNVSSDTYPLFYQWNTGQTTQGIFVTPNISKWYSVIAKANENDICFAKDSIFITVNPKPNPTFHDTSFCDGYSVSYDAGYYNAWTWSDGETGQTHSPVYDSQKLGIKVKDYNGCWSEEKSINFTKLPKPNLELGNDTTFFFGESFVINPQTSSILTQYLWSTGDTTNTLSVNQSGTYSLKATDSNGCTNVDSISLTTTLKTLIPHLEKMKYENTQFSDTLKIIKETEERVFYYIMELSSKYGVVKKVYKGNIGMIQLKYFGVIHYNADYAVRIAYINATRDTSEFGMSSSIHTFDAPTTSILEMQHDISIHDTLRIYRVPNALRYIVNLSTPDTSKTLATNDSIFTMKEFGNIVHYNTQYHLSVKTIMNTRDTSDFGESTEVYIENTPWTSLDTTRSQISFLKSFSDTLYIAPIDPATDIYQYRVKLINEKFEEKTLLINGKTPYFTLSKFGTWIKYDKTYIVQISAIMWNKDIGAYGISSMIHTKLAPMNKLYTDNIDTLNIGVRDSLRVHKIPSVVSYIFKIENETFGVSKMLASTDTIVTFREFGLSVHYGTDYLISVADRMNTGDTSAFSRKYLLHTKDAPVTSIEPSSIKTLMRFFEDTSKVSTIIDATKYRVTLKDSLGNSKSLITTKNVVLRQYGTFVRYNSLYSVSVECIMYNLDTSKVGEIRTIRTEDLSYTTKIDTAGKNSNVVLRTDTLHWPLILHASSYTLKIMSNGVTKYKTYTKTSMTLNDFGTWVKAGSTYSISISPNMWNGEKGMYGEALSFVVGQNILKSLNKTTGIETAASNTFLLYPNPNDGSFTVQLNNNTEPFTLTILDISGRILFIKNYQESIIPLQLKLNPGTYFLKCQNSKQVVTSKFVIHD